MKILALEASTTSAKAMLYDVDSQSFKMITHPYPADVASSTRTDQAEETFLEMLAAGREVIAQSDAERTDGASSASEIEMIALVGVWHSICLCDRSFKPVSPVYHWSHTGATEICREIRRDAQATEKYYHTSGCMVNAIYPFFKIEMMRRMGFPVEDSYLMSQGAYNNLRMTGQRIATRCNASGDGLLNIHTREYNWEGLSEMGIREWQLSPLVDSEKPYPLSSEAAALLGVRSGIPVLPANADGGSNQIGAGAARHGIMTFSMGTSAAMRLSTKEALIPEQPSTWCYLSPKGYLSGAATNGCCICTDWAKQKLFPEGTTYQEIEAGIQDRENTPVFLPFLTGERCPGWNDDRAGGFQNVRLSHTASDLYLAVQEGILFNLYQCYQSLISVNPEPEQIMLSGGILKSPSWTQMCADIFNREMTVTAAEQESLMGGIVMGMEATGVLKDVRDYHPEIIRTIEPDIHAHERYMEKYQRYLTCYNNN